MTIYNRMGDIVTIVRLATMEDVETLEGRMLDERDLEALENNCYVVVELGSKTCSFCGAVARTSAGLIACPADWHREYLHHQAFMRATGGAAEIGAVVDALVAAQDEIIQAAASAPSREPPTPKSNVGRACLWDEKLAVVKAVIEGEYGERVTFDTEDGSTITTTPGLDPRFRWL